MSGRIGGRFVDFAAVLFGIGRIRRVLTQVVVSGVKQVRAVHATLALFEALLVGVAAKRPAETIASLKLLNDLRTRLAGKSIEISVPEVERRRGATRKQHKSRR